MGNILYLGGFGFIINNLATKVFCLEVGVHGLVTTYGRADSGTVSRINDDVNLLINRTIDKVAVVAFVCGIIVGANLVHLVEMKRREKLSHRGKK